MKKSLIVSIVMTLVLVLSLSTATYAWYTSNTQVNVTATTLGTAKASDANIEFRWYNQTKDTILFNGTTISFSGLGQDNGLKPMVPDKKYTGEDAAMNFKTAPITLEGKFATGAATGTPWTQTYTGTGAQYSPVEDVSGFTVSDNGTWWAQNYTRFYKRTGNEGNYVYTKMQWSANPTDYAYAVDTYFTLDANGDPYGITGTVTNLAIGNTANAATGAIKVTATISDGNSSALNDALRIAIFTKGYSRTGTGTSEDPYVYSPDATALYRGVLANGTSNISYAVDNWLTGDVVAEHVVRDEAIEDNTVWTATAGSTGFEIGYINAEAFMEVYVYAWYDGSILNNALSGNSASFELTFNVI